MAHNKVGDACQLRVGDGVAIAGGEIGDDGLNHLQRASVEGVAGAAAVGRRFLALHAGGGGGGTAKEQRPP